MTTHLRRFILTTAAVVLMGGSSAEAATMYGMLYDAYLHGQVQSGGNLAFENYEQTGILFNNSGFVGATPKTLANSENPTPRPPFTSAANNTLRILDGETANRYTFWIRGPSGGPDTFINNLDPASLVELGLTLHWDGLDPLDQVVISNVRSENGIIPLQPVHSWQSSGQGTPLDPLLLQIFIAADTIHSSGVATSHVKVQFDTEIVPIPEPATLALVSLAGLGLLGLFRRRR